MQNERFQHQHNAAAARGSERGHSLIEMLVVVAMVGILAMGAMAAWRTYSMRADLNGTIRSVTSFVLSARLLSVYRGVDHFVVIDTKARTVSIYEDTGSHAGSFDSTDKLVRRNTWPASVAMVLPSNAVPSPIDAAPVTNAWVMPLPDSGAAWGAALRGVVTTPLGDICGADVAMNPIDAGIMVLSNKRGDAAALVIHGKGGTLRTFRWQDQQWKQL